MLAQRSDWTQEIVQQHCIQGRVIENMLTAKAIGGSGTVPPRGGGNNKLNPALVLANRTRRSFECGGPALDLLPGVIAVAVVRGPGGVMPELLLGAGLAKKCQSRPMLVVGSGTAVPP